MEVLTNLVFVGCLTRAEPPARTGALSAFCDTNGACLKLCLWLGVGSCLFEGINCLIACLALIEVAPGAGKLGNATCN